MAVPACPGVGRRDRLLKLRASCGRGKSPQLPGNSLFRCFDGADRRPLAASRRKTCPRVRSRARLSMRPARPWPARAVYMNSQLGGSLRSRLRTDKDGKYSTGALNAGVYTVQVELRNYNANRFFVTVRDGKTSNGDRKLTHVEPGTPTLQGKVSPGADRETSHQWARCSEYGAVSAGRLDPGRSVAGCDEDGNIRCFDHKYSGLTLCTRWMGLLSTTKTKAGRRRMSR